ncbi:MAG: MBL fold metallo-hydrolase [Beijerinckiaceae bacterium]|jgi:glyoxylase-like metal-dependent hydrolase (beta-lactamase superfamily II)|nr:MBL fold metallo-hydrolase [Beijerinckiaceae bacterium]
MIDLSRREAFMTAAAATALAASGLSAATPALAQAAAAGQAPGFYRYKVGDMTVTAINDGFARRPLEGFVRNAELSAVQAAMSAAFLPADALPIAFTTLVVQNGAQITLLDTGNGDSGAPTSGVWMRNFRAAGFTPEQVTRVVFSHFHGDHINGLRLKDGTLTFPNAELNVPAPEWAVWMDDARMGAAPEAMRGAFANVRRVFAPVAANVKQYQPGAEVAPGITSVAAFGHTPGHCVFMISSGTGKLMFMADTTNHPALFVKNPDWSAVFDMDADAARATRRRLLDMAAAEKTQVHFYHAPFPATGFIAKAGNGFDYVPVQWSSAV